MSVLNRFPLTSAVSRQKFPISIRTFSSSSITNFSNSNAKYSITTRSPFFIASRHFSGGPASDPDDPNPQFIPLTGRQLELQELGDFPEPEPVGPFGTLKKPTLVYSGLESRIVGCLGGRGTRHRLLWFTVKEGHPHICRECGQVFKLVNEKNWEEHKDLMAPEVKNWYTQVSKMQSAQKAPSHHH